MERGFLEVKKTVEFVADGGDNDNISWSSIVICIARSSFTHTHTHTLTHISSKKGTYIPDSFLLFTSHHHSLAKENPTTETETKAEAKTKTTKEKKTTKAS